MAAGSATAAVRAGDHLKVVAVGRGEVEAAAAVVGVVPRRAVAGVGEGGDAALAQAGRDGVEVVLGDQERVVLLDDLVFLHEVGEVQAHAVVQLDDRERPE